MTEVGGMRPPRPTIVAAGSGLPCERTVTVGDTSSVVVRFAVAAPPGRNSLTVALTRTASPTLTEVGAVLVKTKMPSDVAGSASGFGSCMLNPFDRLAVTTPGTLPKVCPTRGEICDAPWMSWMNVGDGGVASVVKLNT